VLNSVNVLNRISLWYRFHLYLCKLWSNSRQTLQRVELFCALLPWGKCAFEILWLWIFLESVWRYLIQQCIHYLVLVNSRSICTYIENRFTSFSFNGIMCSQNRSYVHISSFLTYSWKKMFFDHV